MNAIRCLCGVAMAALLVSPAVRAQEAPKPGPEHVLLKKMEGTWDATMKIMGGESKGTMVYKMDLGGLWLTSTFDGEFGGLKFSGRGFDTFDAAKKKYVGVWVDSMSTAPMTMEGAFDKEKNELTMNGQGPGMDGKTTKYKTVTHFKDNDNVVFDMYMGDDKEPSFTITYKRKK